MNSTSTFSRDRVTSIGVGVGCLVWFLIVAYVAERLFGDWHVATPLRPQTNVSLQTSIPECSTTTIMTKNSLVASAMLAGQYLAFVPTFLGLTVNAAIAGLVYFPVLADNAAANPLLVYGLFEEGAFVLIATVVFRSTIPARDAGVCQCAGVHIPVAAAMIVIGAVLEGRLCP